MSVGKDGLRLKEVIKLMKQIDLEEVEKMTLGDKVGFMIELDQMSIAIKRIREGLDTEIGSIIEEKRAVKKVIGSERVKNRVNFE